MSSEFTLNPIKLNLISINNTIKQTIVFIGLIPKNVKEELIKIESNKKYNNKIITDFYGKNWEVKLGIKSKRGGDEFSFDENSSPEEVIKSLESGISDPPSDEVIDPSDNSDPSGMPDPSPDKINNMNISIDDLLGDDDIISDNSAKVHQITKIDSNKFSIRFIFSDPYLSIYPEDKVLEFKKKIYTVLNIPIFRQHIWYVYQNRTFPLNYSIFQNSSLKYFNVQDMLNKYNDKNQQLIENIPVSTRYYQIKTELKVTTNDAFSILEDFYYKFGITEYNLLDLDDFIAPSRKNLVNIITERYQLELIYYSFIMIYWPMLSITAFSDYIKSESNIPKYYPDLQQPIQELNQIFKLEKKIMDTKADLITNPKKKETLKDIKNTISNSIVYAIISILTYQNSRETILFIRNLFDKFPLNDTVIGAKCYLSHEGKKITLNKTYKKNSFITDIIDLDSIMFKIKVTQDTIKTINLVFYKNGNYIIKSTWREEDNYDFDDIFDIVLKLTKPVIDTINSFGHYVLSNKRTLPVMNKQNSKFTEICMSMFYKKSFTQEQFEKLKSIMVDYRKAGIVRDRNIENSVMEFYFSKGMYQFQSDRIERVVTTNNYYDFLTDGTTKQKWYTIFDKTRITRFYHRMTDIKIEIIGVKENEFFIFYNLIMTLFNIFDSQDRTIHKNPKSENELRERNLKKSLRNLKEQDPVLYNFKKLYKTENIYSKICQKPYQPLLLNKQSYDSLPKDKKANAIKYWNFTTNKDAYYSCPNTKYPYIKFIVKRHPKDYCIPCCKKTQLSENTKEARQVVYDICMKDHKYTKEERTITLGSRYIMTYGKDIEPGRLSRLPDDSLEPLFYETYSIKEQGIDPECSTDDGFYLYGIDQNINGANVGILNILIHAQESSIVDFIGNLIKLLKITPSKFRILLNGNIIRYFNSVEHFTTTLYELFIDNGITGAEEVPWNDIFINIAYLFLNINIVNFAHEKNEAIKLTLPSYITNKDQFLSNEFKNLLVFKKRNNYYPIYQLNTDVFFKSKLFTKKLFIYNDSIIIIISRLVEAYFNELIKKKIVDNINLSVIYRFVKNSDYKIANLFINSSNMCYYVHLKSAGENIYIPIELSYHIETEKVSVTYDMFLRDKYKMSITSLMKFAKDFNHWIAVKSSEAGLINIDMDKKLPLEERVEPIYPYIKVQNWLVVCSVDKKISPSSEVIGFIANDLNYYITPIKLAQAQKIKDVKIIQLFYDPDIINKQIFMKSNVIFDDRCKKIGKSVYDSNLYQLILLEFMNLFTQQTNVNMRQKIKKILLGNFNRDFDDLMDEIDKLVTDCEDYEKIKDQICEFINNHHNKNQLFKEMDNTYYKFDREVFEKIKKLPKDKLVNELEKLSHKFVTYGKIDDIKDFEFPNMFITCQSKLALSSKNHCKAGKFIIEKSKLKNILEIMASDILNPVKEKWLFSSVFADNVISFFKFNRRLDEQITIEIE